MFSQSLTVLDSTPPEPSLIKLPRLINNAKLKFQIGPYHWHCSLTILISYACLMAVFISAGIWQLARADEKQVLLDQRKHAQVKPELEITDNTDYQQDRRYTRVTVTGQYDPKHQFLIDNQVYNKKVGYFVMTPFLPKHQQTSVLINRGWVAANLDRTIFPDLSLQNTAATVTGRLNNFPGVGIELAGAKIPSTDWPSVVQLIDSQVLANKLKYSLHKFQIQLDVNMADGYQRSWKSAMQRMPPEKHKVYALQWFAFALILTVLLVKALKVKKETDEFKTKS